MTWMDHHGGDSRTAKFVEIRPPEMGAALEAHRIDAGEVFEPFASQAKSVARNLGNANDGFAPNIMLCGYIASDAWLAGHADIASKFARAIRQSSEWGNAHHAESGIILGRYTKIDPAIIATMARAEYGLTIAPSMVDPIVASALKYGIIDKTVSIADLVWKNPNP
jgi:NitT/TauT family transport system substrate-binding protein